MTAAPTAADPDAARKQQLIAVVDKDKQVQVMVDTLFSFGELGSQEFETSRYRSAYLEKNGFKVERGIDGIPTAWMATWSNGTGGSPRAAARGASTKQLAVAALLQDD